MKELDTIVVGGGIVGLAVAWSYLKRNPDARLAVLEKEAQVARHQTGHNSGVIHSGIYYKPGSLKARLCRAGNQRLLRFCDEQGISYDLCGKVIVATDAEERARMEVLFERGIANGLDVEKLSASQVREIEPNVQSVGGIRVPSTGIVDFGGVCRRLSGLIEEQGGEVLLGTEVSGIISGERGVVVESSRGELQAKHLINCAGLHSDRLARRAGTNPEAKIIPFRGEYYELTPESRSLVKNLIYPVPDPQFPFLGVHFTRMMDGSVHAGPNAVLSLKREGYRRCSFNLRDFAETVSYRGFWRLAARHARAGMEEMHRSWSKRAFVRSLQKLIPAVRSQDLIPAGAGVRAQALRGNGDLVDDFLILNGGPTLHVCNAPSPAATSALEIAQYVVDKMPGRN